MGRRWVIVLLLGVGMAVVGWLALGERTPSADAQTVDATLTPSSDPIDTLHTNRDPGALFGFSGGPSMQSQTPTPGAGQVTWRWQFTFQHTANFGTPVGRFAYRVYPSSESPATGDLWQLTSLINLDPANPAVPEFLSPPSDGTFPVSTVLEIVTPGLMAGTEYTFEVTPAIGQGINTYSVFPGRLSATAMATTLSMAPTVATTSGPEVPGREVPGGDGVADARALYSACPGVDAEGSGFADVGGSFALAEIACISHFGITQGRTATMFAPAETISRWQMALFLFRAAGPAGVDLADPASDQGFTDIGDLSAEAQQAANALAAANIMPGISDTEFLPNALMSRADTAVLLDAFLGQAIINSGGTHPNNITPNDNVFTDLEDATIATYDAIRRVYELGITRGVTATQFGPDELVTREQMAALVVRMLAHTQAKPAGISLQQEIGETPVAGEDLPLLVSLRDAEFLPVIDTNVDLFYYLDTDADEAFDDTGACSGEVVRVGNVLTACRIDLSDSLTDDLGDAEVSLTSVPTESATVVAWTGSQGDTFDNDTTDRATLPLESRRAARQVVVSDNLAETQQKIPYGDTYQLTLQISDEDGNPVAISGEHINLRTVETTSTGTTTTTARNYRTDSNGQVSLSFTQTNPQDLDTEATVSVNIQAWPSAYTLVDETTNNCPEDVCTATWSDATPTPTTLRLTQTSQYTIASDVGRGSSNRVIGTLTDQYGAPIRGEQIGFILTSINEDEPAAVRTTRSNGQTSYTYYRDDNTSTGESISLVHIQDGTQNPDITSMPESHYWVTAPADDEIPAMDKDVYVGDTANNRIVYLEATDEFRIVEYDSNDQVNSPTDALTLDTFETTINDNPPVFDDTNTLTSGTRLDITGYSQNSEQVSSFTITPFG